MEPSRNKRIDAFACAALAALSLALWLPRFAGPIDLRYDAGVYSVLGSSLAEGKGYRLLNEPGEIEAIQYPPLLPLLVAAHERLAGSSEMHAVGHLLRISFFLLFTAYGLAVYFLARSFLGAGPAFLAAVVSQCHVLTIFMGDLLFGEVPFALTTVLCLLVLKKARSLPGRAGAGVLAVAAYLLRSVGLALLAAWVAAAALERRYGRAALRLAVALVPVLLWQGHIGRVKASEEYRKPAYEYQRADYQFYNVGYVENITLIDSFKPELGRADLSLIARRFLTNLSAIPLVFGEAVSFRREFLESQLRKIEKRVPFFPPSSLLATMAFGLLGILILMGLFFLLRAREWTLVLYVAASVGLVCLTPWPQQFIRYLTPLIPLLAIALGVALTTLAKTRKPAAWAAGGIVALLLAGQALALWHVYTRFHHRVRYTDSQGIERRYRLFFYGRSWPALDQSLDWLRDHSQPSDVIATSCPHWTWLRTGRKAVMPPFEPDPAEAERLLDTVPVTWVIVDELEFTDVSRRYAARMAEARPESWRKVYTSRSGEVRVYRRVASGNAASPPGGAK
ncbi:MAG TPA: hypothetical protein VLQ45_30890 [Thermoanaerobaculia bacterium]|nr:hypothetical protein [Thermoanaerobaculia bacterium]